MFDLQIFIKDFFKMPSPCHHKAWIKVYVDMAVHTRKQKPEELLLCRRPNETSEVYNYRLKNYKAITYGSMNRALDELYRIFSNIGFKINAPDNVLELINNKIYNNLNFIMFMQQIVLRRMIEDPNGLLVWLPSGEGVTESSVKVVPKPYLVYSRDVHYISEDVISFLSQEKSLVKKDKEDVYEGNVFYIVTKDSFYKLYQYGKQSDNKYQLELIYEHAIGEIPYMTLGGDMNSDGFYESFFSPYLAFGDEAICQFSDWQAVMVTSSHPFIEEFQSECEVPVRTDKSSNPVPEGEELYTRNTELRPMTKSPYNTIIRRIPGEYDKEGMLDPNIASIRFIHPDINVAKYVGESWQKLIEMAEDALHLNLGRGILSGEAKSIDKQSQEAMLAKIGNSIFNNLMLNSVIYIDAYYNFNQAKRSEISIDKPNTYEVKTEADILAELTVLKEKKAPSFFLQESTVDLAKKRFSGNKLSQKIFTYISLEDALFIYSIEEKSQMLLQGAITKDNYIRSVYMYTILLEIAYTVGINEFIVMEIEKISDLFEQEIIEYLPEAQTPIFDNTAGGGE